MGGSNNLGFPPERSLVLHEPVAAFLRSISMSETLMQVPKVTNDTVTEGSIRHLVELTGDLLTKSKRSKTIPPAIRGQIVEIHHCSTMALMRLKSDS